MNYKFFFGTAKEQKESFLEIEKELFMRRVVMVSTISDVLKDSGVKLFLRADECKIKLDFVVEKEGYDETYGFGLHDIYSLIMYCNTRYGLQKDFIEQYNPFLEALLYFEERMEVENVKYIEIPSKILIDDNSLDWLKIIFESCNKKELYHFFIHEVLKKELSNKKNDNKVIKI